MFATIRNAWRLADLRKKLIFTIMIILLYRIGNIIPVPFVDTGEMGKYFELAHTDTILGLYNTMSGSAFSQASVLALSIQPYINASIIIQLLTIAIPALERLQKDGGEEGKKKLNMITRCTTVGLGLLMGWAYYMMISKSGYNIVTHPDNVWAAIVIIVAFAAGSAIVMWLGEQITEHGIGNGISIILFANIVSRVDDMVLGLNNMANATDWWKIVVTVVGMLALVVLIVYVNDAERRIPIQYAKRVVGRKVYGGQNTNLPIKVSMTGVMPVIFAQSIVSLPATIWAFANWDKEMGIYKYVFSADAWAYAAIYFLLIFFFSWFYASIQYDPVEISNNLKKNGGFIPGFRPGKPTSDFIKKVISKIVVFGAVYLGIVALLPILAGKIPGLDQMAIGGTSIIIVVSVALETVKALEAQMLMRHYKGFLD